jgi:DNA-binding NarL/FixJ family response regulator
MLSSDRVEGTILDAKKYGAKGYIAKPFTPEKLISCYNKVPTVQKQAL